jgi:hypothetical protein
MEATGAPAPSATGVDRDEESARRIRRRLVKRVKASATQSAQLVEQLRAAQLAAMGTGELCPVSRALRCRGWADGLGRWGEGLPDQCPDLLQ